MTASGGSASSRTGRAAGGSRWWYGVALVPAVVPAAVVGVLVPPLLLGVTLRYLHLRYRHVGLS